jgi:hypothetical protein
MRSYEAARSLFSFLAFVAWSVVVIGVLVALIGMGSVSQYAGGGAGLLAMVPGIGIALAGFIQVAFIQMGRATVDTAEYTQQMLKIARDQLDVSKQGLKLQETRPTSFATASRTDSPAEPMSSFAGQAEKTSPPSREVKAFQPKQSTDESTFYKRRMIQAVEGKYIVSGKPFETMGAAKEYIDSIVGPQVNSLHGANRNT